MLVVTLKQPKSKNPLSAGDDNIDNDGEELQEKAMTKEMMKAEMMKKMEGMKAKNSRQCTIRWK